MPAPIPRGIDFERWAAEVFDLASAAGFEIPRPPAKDGWRDWSDRLRETGLESPRHDGHASWDAWAERFVEQNYEVI